MYFSEAKNFRIAVIPRYKDDSSTKHHSHWEYSVFIENNSKSTIQLIGKYWRITYADGSTHAVFGHPSVEESYIIQPGHVFESRNTAKLNTSSAIIKGHYTMTSRGKEINVDIPIFSLDNPYIAMALN